MKVTVKRLNKDVLFEGTNAEGNTIQLDGSSAVGGVGKGMRPTEALLTSLASCSSIDVVVLLKKMRQQLEDIQVEVTGCLLYTSPSPRDRTRSRMPSSA